MRLGPLATLAVIPFLLGAAPAAHASGGADDNCVSRAEYGDVHHGESLGHVQREVGSHGRVVAKRKAHGVTTVRKEYDSCSGLTSEGTTVHVRYDDHVKRGSMRVVSVTVDDHSHDAGDDNGGAGHGSDDPTPRPESHPEDH